jgi:hypothetical protein
MTDQERKAYITALIRERAGYVAAGKKDRVAAVDAELSRVGHKAATPSARATKRSN